MTTSIALLFPGSGSQYKGMMRSLYDESAVVRQTLEEADDILGTPLSKVILEGGTAKLNKIGHMLPAICTASVAHYRLYMERVGVSPVFMAGHSLGEYSALICSGALTFRSGLELVRIRSKLAEEVMESTAGSMSILKNVNPARIAQLCAEMQTEGREVGIACWNSPSQVSVSGVDNAVQELERRVTETDAGAQAMHLIGSAPYHCGLMRSRAEEMERVLCSHEWRMPSCPVLSNVTGRPYTSVEEFWVQLPRQLYQPVQWLDSVAYMMQRGVETFIEMGPQNVLKNIMTDITDKAKVYAHDEKLDRAQIVVSYSQRGVGKQAAAGRGEAAAGEDPRLKAVSMCLTHAVTTRNHNENFDDSEPIRRYEEMKRIKQELDQGVQSIGSGHVEQAFQMLGAMFEAKGTPAAEREIRWKQIKDKTGLAPQTAASWAGREE